MTTKTTGAEWKKFYGDREFWPYGAWHDDEEITIDGTKAPIDADLSIVSDDAAITVAAGVVFLVADADDGPTLEAYFKRWRKKQTTVFLSVEVSKEKAEAVRVAIIHAGGKVSRANVEVRGGCRLAGRRPSDQRERS